ncbi:hypothetical protein GOP47_0016762 [Adiantum capillus-veneris]|uniref:Uncharacterized protein n=1 Tax=Adiantum capillus-veneris TaxID=13818 RepID=A0A9D4UIN8_ADICA|nr:hypothetical protein GOP47_0016762 [Adiantum capillus-veneris]
MARVCPYHLSKLQYNTYTNERYQLTATLKMQKSMHPQPSINQEYAPSQEVLDVDFEDAQEYASSTKRQPRVCTLTRGSRCRL